MNEIHPVVRHCITSTLDKASLILSMIRTKGHAPTDIKTGCLVLFLLGAEDNRNISPTKLNLKQGSWQYSTRNFNLSLKQSNTKFLQMQIVKEVINETVNKASKCKMFIPTYTCICRKSFTYFTFLWLDAILCY
jgi:hypothetical protein